MMRLYCPDLNVFVDPTDRNVLIWYQQHRVDPTIGVLQTYMLYEATRKIQGEKYWDADARRIRYGKPRKAHVSGRYRLYAIPWSGLSDRNRRPIFHGDILQDGERPGRVCEVHRALGIRFLKTDDGAHWNFPTSDYTDDMAIVDSAILNPNMIGELIRNLFIYPNPET